MIESAWPDHPGYSITATVFDGVGRVQVGELVVAESSRCLVVAESDHVDQLYFPLADVRWDHLSETDHHTTCPFKGQASYWTLRTPDGDVYDNVAWTYPEPFEEVTAIGGHVAFYHDRQGVTVTVTEQWSDDPRDHITKRFPLWGSAADLVRLMDAQPVGEHQFRAPPYPDPPHGTFFEHATELTARNVIEGGQLLGAALTAASKTDPTKRVTSAYALFLKAASFAEPLDIEVEVLRAGRTVTAVAVTLGQSGTLRCHTTVLLDAGTEHLLHESAAMPDVAGPHDSPSLDMSVEGRDLREVDGSYRARMREVGPPEVDVWARFRHRPDHDHQQQALLAQASTHWTIAAAMRPHEDLCEADAHVTVSTGPLAVAIAFHDDVDVTEWMLYHNRAIYSGHGHAQGEGRVHALDGRLLASYSLQAMIRPFTAPPAGMGGYQNAM